MLLPVEGMTTMMMTRRSRGSKKGCEKQKKGKEMSMIVKGRLVELNFALLPTIGCM